MFRLLRFLTEDDIDIINFNYIVSAILTSSFNNLFYECHLLLEFIGEYNNYFTNAHLDLILTRLIDKIQNSSHPASYLLYKDIYKVPRMNFDLLLSGVFLYPNSEAIVCFAENLNSMNLYKLMVEVKRRNQKILMDYFCKYYIDNFYMEFSIFNFDKNILILNSKVQEIESIDFNSIINFLYKIYSCSYLFSVDYDDLDNFTASFVFEKLFYFYNIKIK